MITVVRAPQVNTNDDRVEVVAWHVDDGTYVEVGQEIADLETSKAVVTLTAESAGFIDCLVGKRSVVRVGAPLFRLASSRDELEAAETQRTEFQRCSELTSEGAEPSARTARTQPPGQIASHGGRALAGARSTTRLSKAATLLLAERGRSAEELKGAGLLTASALKALLGLGKGPQLAEKAVRWEPVSLAKQAEIAALATGESGNINSRLSVQFDSAPIRRRLASERLFDGNPQPLILFEIARLLGSWPQFTAYYAKDSIYYYDRIDLGLAVDLGRGLKVVTIADADKLMPVEFFERTLDFGARYLDNRLRPEELADSTLTITDLSGFGILEFHPLINGRQSAIIGLGGDQTLPGHPMRIHMTFDHRVASGREVAAFLNELRERLMSYADDHERREERERLPVGTSERQRALSGATRCDRCGVESARYFDLFRQDAYLLAYFREDGTVGGVCHRCFGRWN